MIIYIGFYNLHITDAWISFLQSHTPRPHSALPSRPSPPVLPLSCSSPLLPFPSLALSRPPFPSTALLSRPPFPSPALLPSRPPFPSPARPSPLSPSSPLPPFPSTALLLSRPPFPSPALQLPALPLSRPSPLPSFPSPARPSPLSPAHSLSLLALPLSRPPVHAPPSPPVISVRSCLFLRTLLYFHMFSFIQLLVR